MILAYFKPLLGRWPTSLGHSLASRAWPLDRRMPEPIEQLVERLDGRLR